MKLKEKEKNPAAVALGRRAAGKPKNLTEDQRHALAERMRKVSKEHHAKQKAKKEINILRQQPEVKMEALRDWEDDSKQYQPV